MGERGVLDVTSDMGWSGTRGQRGQKEDGMSEAYKWRTWIQVTSAGSEWFGQYLPVDFVKGGAITTLECDGLKNRFFYDWEFRVVSDKILKTGMTV